jgi:hypothetical protein
VVVLAEAVSGVVAGTAVAGSVGSIGAKILDVAKDVVDKAIQIFSDPLKGVLVSIAIVKATGLVQIDPERLDSELERFADSLINYDPVLVLGTPPTVDVSAIVSETFKEMGVPLGGS